MQEEIYEYVDKLLPIEQYLITENKNMQMSKNTAGVKCPNCGSENIFVRAKQMRSADETKTKFYTCIDCHFTWKLG